MSHFHSVSRKFINPAKKISWSHYLSPAQLKNPACIPNPADPLWFEPSSSSNLLQQAEGKSGWWVQTMKGYDSFFQDYFFGEIVECPHTYRLCFPEAGS